MPASEADLQKSEDAFQPLTELPFPPVTKSHILNCSIHSWYPRYRAIIPKSRLIPLSDAFVAYLKADGILLPPDETSQTNNNTDDWDSDSGIFSKDDEEGDDDEDDTPDPSQSWREIHNTITTTITELGGKVNPKLNWSSPKDATWINATNSMECRTPNDVYLLLKSSDFVTHDLEHAFDGTAEELDPVGSSPPQIPYTLLLRKHVPAWNPALEFRAFVRQRRLIGVCQRDQNHYDFLEPMRGRLLLAVENFFEKYLMDDFPDENFVFDVYIPGPRYDKVWLVDINPWAVRTDPLLFSWLELLTIETPGALSDEENGSGDERKEEGLEEEVVRLQLNGSSDEALHRRVDFSNSEEQEAGEADVVLEMPEVELRLVGRDDPEATNFNSPLYSAHKLPREVVEASQSGPGPMREFAERWKEVLEKAERGGGRAEDDDSDD